MAQLKIIDWLTKGLPQGNKLVNFIGKVSIFVTILSILFGFLFMLMQTYENHKGYRTSEILIGVAPFHIDKSTDVIDEYAVSLIPSNNYLRDLHLPYRFTPYMAREMTYPGVIKELKEGGIQMAFLSMGLYTALQNNKLGDSDFKKDYELIGFMRKKQSKVYYSGIACKANSKADSNLHRCFYEGDTLSKYIRKKKETCNYPHKFLDEDTTFCIILVNDEYSTSGHIVPENWLLDNGVNVRDGCHRHHLMNRGEMKEAIKKDSRHIGFMSNEDFERLNDTTNFRFYPITEIPIPYDAIVVNRKWWRQRGVNTRNQLIKALDSERIGLTRPCDDNNIEERIGYFQEYTHGGVIYHVDKDTLLSISIPNQVMDIYGFYCSDTTPVPVQLFRYNGGGSIRQHFVSSKTVISTEAILVRDKDKYKIINKNDQKAIKIDAKTRFIPRDPMRPEDWRERKKDCEDLRKSKAKSNCKCKD